MKIIRAYWLESLLILTIVAILADAYTQYR